MERAFFGLGSGRQLNARARLFGARVELLGVESSGDHGCWDQLTTCLSNSFSPFCDVVVITWCEQVLLTQGA